MLWRRFSDIHQVVLSISPWFHSRQMRSSSSKFQDLQPHFRTSSRSRTISHVCSSQSGHRELRGDEVWPKNDECNESHASISLYSVKACTQSLYGSSRCKFSLWLWATSSNLRSTTSNPVGPAGPSSALSCRIARSSSRPYSKHCFSLFSLLFGWFIWLWCVTVPFCMRRIYLFCWHCGSSLYQLYGHYRYRCRHGRFPRCGHRWVCWVIGTRCHGRFCRFFVGTVVTSVAVGFVVVVCIVKVDVSVVFITIFCHCHNFCRHWRLVRWFSSASWGVFVVFAVSVAVLMSYSLVAWLLMSHFC